MKEKHSPDTIRNCREAYICAEAFQSIAEQYIPHISSIVEDWPSRMSQEIGALVVCATNLSFAIELYLKALIIYYRLPVPKTHDLSSLYDELPIEVKSFVENTYTAAYRKEWLNRRASITLAKGPARKPEWNDNSERSIRLPDLLSRSKTMFESWRYIFESDRSVERHHKMYEFEYGLLRTAAESMRVEMKLRLEDKDPEDR